MRTHRFLKAVLTAVAAFSLSSVLAQNYPNKTINLIVPYPAGGPSDFFARKVQPDAQAKLGQTMIIDNVGGAGGSIGLSKVLSAPADGSRPGRSITGPASQRVLRVASDSCP